MTWLKDDNSSIYDPSYEDMLRVSFIHMFSRGKLKDLVSLLSGRDFITRDYKEEIAEESFNKLSTGIISYKKKCLISRLSRVLVKYKWRRYAPPNKYAQ